MKITPRITTVSRLAAISLFVILAAALFAAPIPIDEDAPWPRVRSTNGHTVTLHLPQVERWTSNSFTARAAVEVKLANAKTELLGVVWFEAHGSVDRSNRAVMLDRIGDSEGKFPHGDGWRQQRLAIVRECLPAGARTVSLDYLVTALGFVQAAARQGTSGLKHEPPQIIWVTNRSVLILVDGEPVLRPVAGTSLERVINTPALLVHDKTEREILFVRRGPMVCCRRGSAARGVWRRIHRRKSPPSSPRRINLLRTKTTQRRGSLSA
jgi:hypothetical protein